MWIICVYTYWTLSPSFLIVHTQKKKTGSIEGEPEKSDEAIYIYLFIIAADQCMFNLLYSSCLSATLYHTKAHSGDYQDCMLWSS